MKTFILTLALIISSTTFVHAEDQKIQEASEVACQNFGGWAKSLRSEEGGRICVDGEYNGFSIVESVSQEKCEFGGGWVKASRSDLAPTYCIDGLFSLVPVLNN